MLQSPCTKGDIRVFHKFFPLPNILPVVAKIPTFCRISSSSGLKSRSMEEILSRLFLRPIPAAKGFAIIPGDIYKAKRQKPGWKRSACHTKKFHTLGSQIQSIKTILIKSELFHNLKHYFSCQLLKELQV